MRGKRVARGQGEVGKGRMRTAGGGRGQKREKTGRVRTVATSGGTNGTLVSVGEEKEEEEKER